MTGASANGTRLSVGRLKEYRAFGAASILLSDRTAFEPIVTENHYDTNQPSRDFTEEAGIQELRDDFGNYWFDETNCSDRLRRLGLYPKNGMIASAAGGRSRARTGISTQPML